jgi:tRNA pseudouridine13 synthase
VHDPVVWLILRLVQVDAQLPAATIRRELDDFVVEELPAYPPSGDGDHLFVTIVKRDLTTLEAVRRMAEALAVDPRDVGFAGMKDRHAVTTQRLSLPPGCDPAAVEALELDGIEIADVARHTHKLRTAHLSGNRFRLRLRDLDASGQTAVVTGIARLATTGVANGFGPQRFGRDGTLGETALAWVRGESRGPRKKQIARLWFSAFQSLLFNRVLAARLAAGTAFDVVEGDLAKKHDSGGMFVVSPDDLSDARERARRGELSATGPMFGAKMRWPAGEAEALEREVLESAVDPERLSAFKRLGEGTRRPLRMWLGDVCCEHGPDYLELSFVLPKGGYATAVLAEVCRPVDPHRHAGDERPLDPSP